MKSTGLRLVKTTVDERVTSHYGLILSFRQSKVIRRPRKKFTLDNQNFGYSNHEKIVLSSYF